MTDDDKALVEHLKDEWPYMFIGDDEWLDTDALDGQRTQAADRIEALSAENEQARMEERAAIVAWLMREEDGYPSSEYSGFAAMIREEIEAGEHLK